jgi:hypothetical protein
VFLELLHGVAIAEAHYLREKPARIGQAEREVAVRPQLHWQLVYGVKVLEGRGCAPSLVYVVGAAIKVDFQLVLTREASAQFQ